MHQIINLYSYYLPRLPITLLSTLTKKKTPLRYRRTHSGATATTKYLEAVAERVVPSGNFSNSIFRACAKCRRTHCVLSLASGCTCSGSHDQDRPCVQGWARLVARDGNPRNTCVFVTEFLLTFLAHMWGWLFVERR